MVPMTFIWWIYHFWARFWPYFNFVDFRAFFGPFSLVNRDRQKMADLLRKMASNQKMQENKPTLKFNFTIEKRWPVSIFELFGPQQISHWALMVIHLMQEVDVLLRNHCVLLSVNDKGRTPNPVHLEETPPNMDDLSLVSLETEKLEIGFGFPKQFFL